MHQLLKTKKCASTLPYVLVSNLASFLFYSRYYNGNLIEDENIAREMCSNLIEQLLSTEAQKRIEPNFESAYFDHLRWLKTVQAIDSDTINTF